MGVLDLEVLAVRLQVLDDALGDVLPEGLHKLLAEHLRGDVLEGVRALCDELGYESTITHIQNL